MKRIKFRIETPSTWTEEQMLEELKKSIHNFNFNDNMGKQEAIIIISIRKAPKT